MRRAAELAVGLLLLLMAVALQRWAAVETAPAVLADARPVVAAEPTRWSAAPAVVAERAAIAATPAAAPAASVPVWDLCGIGRMPVPAGTRLPAQPPNLNDMPDLPPHLGTATIDAGRAQLLAALRQGGARARAAAAYWAPVPVNDAMTPPGSNAAAEELVALAGDDPMVLRWAVARCQSSACREAVAARWVRIEPDNAVPRLMQMAERASVDADASRLLQAARIYRSYWGAFADTARQAMPAGLPGYVQALLLAEALGIDAAMPESSFMFASSMCKPPFNADGERRARCDTLGRLMSEQGDTFLAFGIGLRLREMAGLDPAQARALREPVRQLQAQYSAIVRMELEHPLSCDSLAGMQHWIEAVGRDGELAAARAAAPNPYSATPPQSR